MRPHRVESPHGAREDPFYWLRDDSRQDPEVLEHLKAEASYSEAMLAPLKPLIESLFHEIVARVPPDDSSVPVRYRGYWYRTKFIAGGEYPIVLRRPDVPGAEEGVLLDCNALAAGHAFFQLGGYEVSPDNRLLAYAEDTVGRRQFRLRVKDLTTGELLPDVLENVEPGIVWHDDNKTLLYVEKDPVTLLGRRVRAHVLGTDQASDRLVYEEPDESFDLEVVRSKSERYLYIVSQSTTSTEWRYARADDPDLEFEVVLAREPNHEYEVEHVGDRFIIHTNFEAKNFRIVSVPVSQCADRSLWRDEVPHDEHVLVQGFEVFRDFLAVSVRAGGLLKIRVQRWGGEPFHLEADDPTYAMQIGSNPELDTTRLRYVYTSLTTPACTYEYDFATGGYELLKREIVVGSFDRTDYTSEFVWVTARDGERVPVSIVRRKSVQLDGTAPLYITAYGAYGLCSDPAFSSARLSLLDRGFVYAIAHVRGGQELGRRWYDAGRLLEKRNTFNDFIDVTDYLVAHGYGSPAKVFAAGGSAGGLLMGVIANEAASKYAGIVAHVPFVDIVTTMLDETIPLTTLEYEEWGDPREREFYDYMLSYSPYDNVRTQKYPPILVTTGLWDSQVQYYEPAKWVAKLRMIKSGDAPVLLRVNLEAGHGGRSGRYERLKEVAEEYGFVIALAEGIWPRTVDPA